MGSSLLYDLEIYRAFVKLFLTSKLLNIANMNLQWLSVSLRAVPMEPG